MKVKELLPLLPRFSDDSGYDAHVAIYDESHRPALFKFCMVPDCKKTYSPYSLLPFKSKEEIYDMDVISLESGHLFAGGNFDESLYIIVKES